MRELDGTYKVMLVAAVFALVLGAVIKLVVPAAKNPTSAQCLEGNAGAINQQAVYAHGTMWTCGEAPRGKLRCVEMGSCA